MVNNLRYFALGAYTGLIALWTAFDKIALDESLAIGLLAPVAVVIGADYLKHKDDNKPAVV